jgi:hypothetical protein
LLTGNVAQTVLFRDLFTKPLVSLFDRSHASSDGGAVLLAAADRRLGLLDRLAGCLEDRRQPGKIRHDLQSLLAQRVHALACGYPDGNDAARLAADPMHKLLAGHDPVGDDLLGSQPTLSRFENAVGPRELFAMAEALADTVIERHRRRLKGRARRITVDLDITDDPTHGAQQLTFFNGFYDTWCYLPLVGFITFDREPEQHLVAAVLRPGNAGRQLGVLGVLRRLVDRLHRAFPKARVLVRLDSGFVFPQLFDYLDSRPRLDYVVAYARNSVLERAAAHDMRLARRASHRSGQTERVYGQVFYQADTWPRRRRVVYKAERLVADGKTPKDNLRFVVSNLGGSAQTVYERIYCLRGDAENRIKELLNDLALGRTSCSRFWANQFRVLVTAAAYALIQEIRLHARGTRLARAQAGTLRDMLLKLGAEVERSVRRFVLHLPATAPYRDAWVRIATGLGACAG